MARIIVAKHTRNSMLTLALCDDNLVGCEFEEGVIYLNLKSNFYKGDVMEPADIKKLLEASNSINAVGELSTKLVAELFPQAKIKTIQKIPFIHIYRS